MKTLAIKKVNDGIVFTAKIVPGSGSPTRICGLLGEVLKIKVAAPPEKGKANRCLINFLAEQLAVKPNDITISSGTTNPVKSIRIIGMSPEMLLEKLNLAKQS